MRLVYLFIFITLPVWGHQSSLSSKGKKLKWQNKNLQVLVQTNTSDLPATTTRNIILDSIAQWNSASSIELTPSSISNNEIIFQSNFSRYGSAVIGVTELSSKSNGEITKATIRLNDNYVFKATPGLYSFSEVFLGDVVSHELGHFFGLSHSEVLNSTMFYSAFSGQATLSSDDQSGIRTKYDGGFGRIRGVVKGGNSVGVLGAHVQLISLKTGDAVGAITDEKGEFDVKGLNLNDTFYIYTSPVKNLSSLPGSFSNVQSEFCPGSFVGSFFSKCGSDSDGYPQGIILTAANSSVDVGAVTINCELKTDSDYGHEKLQSVFGPITVYHFSDDLEKTEKSFVGYFQSPSTTVWSDPDLLQIDLRDFNQLSGHQKFLKVRLLSQPFGNQLEYQMDIDQSSYGQVAQLEMQYSTLLQTYTTDMETLIPLSSTASENTFEISLRSRKLGSSLLAQVFPSADLFSTGQHLPYFLSMSIWEDQSGIRKPLQSTESVLSDNEACLDAPFTFAVKASTSKDDRSEKASAAASAGCGTIDSSDDGDGPSSPGLFVGFFLVSFMMVVVKRTKNFLS